MTVMKKSEFWSETEGRKTELEDENYGSVNCLR